MVDAQTQRGPAVQPERVQAQPPPVSAPAKSPAEPAAVTLSNGKLTVKAQDSDLAAILRQIAQNSGMNIEGLGKTTRVFGDYGPGNPRDILTDLLSGSDYNFVMVGGSANSAPSKLVLSEKSGGPLPHAIAGPAAPDDSDSDDADQEPLGPGAIPHPSPQLTDDTDTETRTQRNLQRLQQMHDQMQQQQEQQEQNAPQ